MTIRPVAILNSRFLAACGSARIVKIVVSDPVAPVAEVIASVERRLEVSRKLTSDHAIGYCAAQ